MVEKKTGVFLCVFIFLFVVFLDGCSSKRKTSVPKNNMRKQMALQRHLKRLNKNNQKLTRILRGSSVINSDTSEIIEDRFINKDNIPEIDRLLNEFRTSNEKTQKALNSYQKALEFDTDKNSTIDGMLDGIADLCEQQSNRKSRIYETMYDKREQNIDVNNLHFGIAAQGLFGKYRLEGSDEDIDYSGTGGMAYLLYAGDNNLTIGLRKLLVVGTTKIDNGSASDTNNTLKHTTDANILSLGFRIKEIETFDVLIQVLIGAGTNTINTCTAEKCETDTFSRGDLLLTGFEIPFYYVFSPGFSLGFQISGYRFETENYVLESDGEKVKQDGKTTVSTIASGMTLGWAF